MTDEQRKERLWQMYQNGEFARIVFPEGMGERRNRDCFDLLIAAVNRPEVEES